MSEITDDEALEQISQGNKDAFGVLYERYVGRIYNYIYYRTGGNVVDAEDLTTRVFYRALEHVPRYKNMGLPFSAWLYRIAHNLVANWYRDRSRHKEVPLEDYSITYPRVEINLPETTLVKSQENEMLLKVVSKLPAERQHLLILKFVERLSNAEIAVILGRSEGAVKSLYHRTLLSLRSEMKKMEINE